MRGISCRWFTPLRPYSTLISQPRPLTLRPYQLSCLEACTDAFKSGLSRIGVSLPTGSGKTTVLLSLLPLIRPPLERPYANGALVIVSSEEVVRQVAEQAKYLLPRLSVEIEQGSNVASGKADITVATYQTLIRGERLAKFNPLHLKIVVVDEAHHSAAPSYLQLLSQFNCDIQDSTGQRPCHLHKIPICGLSATFSRHDQIALASAYEKIVFHKDLQEMIQEGWLCDVRYSTVKVPLGLEIVKLNTLSSDFSTTSLARALNTPSINKLIVQSWQEKASDRTSTLAFCVNRQHVRNLTHMFREANIDARCVDGETPTKERSRLVTAFKAGAFPVLVNCGVFTEGADIPNIDCILWPDLRDPETCSRRW